MQGVDFGRTAADYERYRPGLPDVLFERLGQHGIGAPGQRVLDVATGTANLGRGLARRGAQVVGLDRAQPLLARAVDLDRRERLAPRYVRGVAERLPFTDAAFDVVTASQCWHWFDGRFAAGEGFRVLRPRGVIAAVSFDWLPLPGSLAQATEALIAEHNPGYTLGGGDGISRRPFADFAGAGFVTLESFSVDLELPFAPELWRGRIRASAGVAASLAEPAVAVFDRALEALLARSFPAPQVLVTHRLFVVLGRRP